MKTNIKYKRFVEKVAKHYKISKKEAKICLFEAFSDFLCIEELESYVVRIKEKKLNEKYSIK